MPKGSWTTFSITFCLWFVMSYFVNWPSFVVWWPFLLEILGNMCIAIVCFPSCDVIEINLLFLIKSFFYMVKKSRQKFKHFEKEKSFQSEINPIFHHFVRDFSCQKLSQNWKLYIHDQQRLKILQRKFAIYSDNRQRIWIFKLWGPVFITTAVENCGIINVILC